MLLLLTRAGQGFGLHAPYPCFMHMCVRGNLLGGGRELKRGWDARESQRVRARTCVLNQR